jgi:hypothetical protein
MRHRHPSPSPHASRLLSSPLAVIAFGVSGQIEEVVQSFQGAYSTLRRNEQPSVRRALPPVGWQRTVEQAPQKTTVEA